MCPTEGSLMSEPPQQPWHGNQPSDPTAPLPPTPPVSGTPSSGAPSSGAPSSGTPSSGPPDGGYPPPPPAPGYGQSDPYSSPPAPASPAYGHPDPYSTPPAPASPAYGQSDPYGAPVPPPPPPPGYGGAPYPGQPGVPGQPYPGQPYPGAMPPKKSNGVKIALIIGGIVLLLLCACGGLAVWAVNEAGDEIDKAVDSLPTAAPADPTEDPTAGSTTGDDDETFDKGDCVVNDGTDTAPDLRKVTCAAGSFEVVAKVPFSTDTAQCDNDFIGAGKGKYDSTYRYDQEPGSFGDYVLCLKER